jgi:iron complex transport system substrate-binding protein
MELTSSIFDSHKIFSFPKVIFHFILFTLLFSSLAGCGPGPVKKIVPGASDKTSLSVEATGFTILHSDNYRKLTVIDPWQKSQDNKFEYYLIERGKKVPEALKNKQVFFTPLQHVVCLSTTHIGFLDALGSLHTVCGLSGTVYVSNDSIKNGLSSKRIREVGNEQGLNYEAIVQLKPDVVFAYGVGSEINAQMNKLRDLGIPTVLVGEYLEQSPLGKASWIKFFGAFFEKEVLAGTIFDEIRKNYESVKSSVANVTLKPSVLTGLPFKDTWWIAGGQSNLAVLIQDAGGKFLWRENLSKEAFPVSLEEVFLRASGADFWINCGTAASLSSLMSFDPRFSALPAVKKLQVYNNNLRSTPAGGNDYWESGVMHPDLILSDLVRIFHPEVSGKGGFHYYRKLMKE